MPSIELTRETFAQLESLARPFVDTPETVIKRLIAGRSDVRAVSDSGESDTSGAAIEFSPENIPPLKHAKYLSGSFDGALPDKQNWNSLLRLALIKIMASCSDVDDLRRISGTNVCGGRKQDDGYTYVQSHTFSYQGLNAANVANTVIRCAKYLGCSARFEFEWLNKDGAHKPGKRGRVLIDG